ncbi:MAG TPA: cyclic nucleotide-binding domain-containing protein [Gammaproteobacteria bacterium]|nr:cyclic nucleotide-binding domain-containing protein [Gammaproteobacteria bacterium]
MPDLFERILLLKQSPMFSEVSTEDLRIVAQMLEEESYFAGDRIFDINEHGDCMYILQSGVIGISLNPDPTIKEFVAELGPGECFGEMNLLDELSRSASAHVLEDSIVLSLEKSRLRGLIINYPELSLGMLKGLSLRLRTANLKNSS